MNRRSRGFLGVAAMLGLVGSGCVKDPLSDLDGTVAGIRTDFSAVVVAAGKTVLLTASVIDGRSSPLTTPVTFTACDAKVTVVLDDTYEPVPATSYRAVITGVTAGTSCVDVAGGGQSTQVDVEVN